MKLAIVGSRSITDWEWFHEELNGHLVNTPSFFKGAVPYKLSVLSGGAKGIDTMAKKWAEIHEVDFYLFEPYHLVDKVDFSPKYFFARNRQIARNCDEMVVFWDGESKGTLHILEYAKKIGKKVTVIRYPKAQQ